MTAIRPPTVPEGSARFTYHALTANLSIKDISALASIWSSVYGVKQMSELALRSGLKAKINLLFQAL